MKPLPGVENWSPDACFRVMAVSWPSITTLDALIVFLAAWVFARASSAIVSEYSKRIWFRKAHRDALQKGLDDLKKARANHELEIKEAEGIRLSALRLIEINHALHDDIIKRDIEISLLKEALDKLHCKCTEDSQREAESLLVKVLPVSECYGYQLELPELRDICRLDPSA